jgi:uridine kinase
MDDFFLPFHLRTPDRLALPGGNVHHERFAEEVLAGLEAGGGFAYRRFDCATGRLEDRFCPHAPLVIVEGSYSLHPALARYYDLRVLLDISPEKQSARILKRNGEEKHKQFMERWIPLENRYFEYTCIEARCDMRLVMEEEA